jgi:hypothetical protein
MTRPPKNGGKRRAGTGGRRSTRRIAPASASFRIVQARDSTGLGPSPYPIPTPGNHMIPAVAVAQATTWSNEPSSAEATERCQGLAWTLTWGEMTLHNCFPMFSWGWLMEIFAGNPGFFSWFLPFKWQQLIFVPLILLRDSLTCWLPRSWNVAIAQKTLLIEVYSDMTESIWSKLDLSEMIPPKQLCQLCWRQWSRRFIAADPSLTRHTLLVIPRAAEMPTRRSGSDPTAMNVTAQSRCECLYSPPFKHGETPCVDSWVWVTCGDIMTFIPLQHDMFGDTYRQPN